LKSEATPSKQRKRLGIGLHLFTGFFLFTAITVGLLWLFQVVFMNSFYKTIRMYSIHQRAHDIILCLDRGEDPEDAVRNAVLADQMDVLISDDTGRRISIGLSSGNDVFSELRSWELMALYYDTLRNGGNVFQHYTQQNQNNADIIHPADNAESVLYLHAVQGERGDGRLAIIFAGIEPVRSTIETLRVQLGAITVIMLLLSIGLALIISLRISRPIVRMNRAAAQLAQGNYNVHFAESGAKETTELARSLNVAAYELSRVEELRRDLLANVSHDLRTPLTMITGYAEVMRDIPGENTPENVQVIIDEATRLTTLVNDLLDLSRLQSGKIDLNMTDYSLTASIRTILQRYDRLIDYHFVFENSGDVRIFADELKITQVIYNLVNNAVTYTGADKKVLLRQLVLDNTVRIEVIDTGEGIPEDKLADIWERYYKVDREHKRAQVGTGLGLSIVKTVVAMHGGTCGVQSKIGEGSVFWFELPLPDENS